MSEICCNFAPDFETQHLYAYEETVFYVDYRVAAAVCCVQF